MSPASALRPTLAVVAFLALGSSLAARTAEAHDPHPPHSDDPRFQCRFHVEIPNNAVFANPPASHRATDFAPEVDDIVSGLTLQTFDAFLRDLSGETTVSVDGKAVSFETRYSLNTEGQASWIYVYETLEALGYDVRYQEYSRSGFDLRNIVARIPGQETPEEIYVLGGHLDSISEQAGTLAPGAEDNASGSAAVLAAAVALLGQQFSSTIELVLFTGEEQGLWGSQAYVAEAQSEGRDVRSAVTCDMISAWNDDYGVLIEGEEDWESLMFLVGDAVDEYTTISRQFSYFSFGSDHVPFQNAGIPAILAIDLDWGSYAPYHRSNDTYDKTDPTLGHKISQACLAAVAQQAGPLGSSADAPTPPMTVSLHAQPNPVAGPFGSVTVRFTSSARKETPSGADSQSPGFQGTPRGQVFDVTGREIRTLQPASVTNGSASVHEVTWDLRNADGWTVRPGLYWVRMGSEATQVVVLP